MREDADGERVGVMTKTGEVYYESLFRLAEKNDPHALLAALPGGTRPSEIRNRDGQSLILYCHYRGLVKCRGTLVALPPGPNLHESAALGMAERCRDLLMRAGGMVNMLSPDGWSALHLAAFFGHSATVKMLLSMGADPDLLSRAFERNLPLHAACAGRQAAAALILADVTENIDATQEDGWTPLMIAARNGLKEVAAALILRGADPWAVNAQGLTALDHAREGGHADLADTLERAEMA